MTEYADRDGFAIGPEVPRYRDGVRTDETILRDELVRQLHRIARQVELGAPINACSLGNGIYTMSVSANISLLPVDVELDGKVPPAVVEADPTWLEDEPPWHWPFDRGGRLSRFIQSVRAMVAPDSDRR